MAHETNPLGSFFQASLANAAGFAVILGSLFYVTGAAWAVGFDKFFGIGGLISRDVYQLIAIGAWIGIILASPILALLLLLPSLPNRKHKKGNRTQSRRAFLAPEAQWAVAYAACVMSIAGFFAGGALGVGYLSGWIASLKNCPSCEAVTLSDEEVHGKIIASDGERIVFLEADGALRLVTVEQVSILKKAGDKANVSKVN